MIMHKTLLIRDDIDRLFEDNVDTLIRCLKDYIKKSKERLITVTRNYTNNTRTNRITITRKQGGAHGVMVIIVGNGHGDTSSNPG